VQTIQPTSALPTITDPVIIDGYTQPGSAQNTDANGFNGTLLIELNGTNAGNTNGLTISAGNSTVRGPCDYRFCGEGTLLTAGGGDVIAGNFIGTDATGTHALGNAVNGIVSSGGLGGNLHRRPPAPPPATLFPAIATVASNSKTATGDVLQGNFHRPPTSPAPSRWATAWTD